MPYSKRNYSKENPLYDHTADDPFYLFLKTDTYLLDIPHYHESLELIFMLSGKARAHLSGSEYDLEEGDIFIANRKHVHFYENFDSDKLCFIIVFSNKYTHDFRQIYPSAHFPPLLRDKEKNQRLFALIQQWAALKQRTFLLDCAYANAFLDLLIKLYDFADSGLTNELNGTAIRFINYINEHYMQSISLETAAQHFGYSREYFSKIFKRTVGKNFLSFLSATRTEKAIELLSDPDNKMSLGEICAKCGFNNSATLYRHLKRSKQTLQTP